MRSRDRQRLQHQGEQLLRQQCVPACRLQVCNDLPLSRNARLGLDDMLPRKAVVVAFLGLGG
jgi:hypothetical protein